MKFQGAKVKEQGVTFGIIIVKSSVLNDATKRSEIRTAGKFIFGNIPIILMAQDSQGTPTYYGRRDIVNFLASIHPSQIPWEEYTVG